MDFKKQKENYKLSYYPLIIFIISALLLCFASLVIFQKFSLVISKHNPPPPIQYIDNPNNDLGKQFLKFSSSTPLIFQTKLNYCPEKTWSDLDEHLVPFDPINNNIHLDETYFSFINKHQPLISSELYALLIDNDYWDFLSSLGKDNSIFKAKTINSNHFNLLSKSNLQKSFFSSTQEIKPSSSFWTNPIEFCVLIDEIGLVTPLLKTTSSGQEKTDNIVQYTWEKQLLLSPPLPNYYLMTVYP